MGTSGLLERICCTWGKEGECDAHVVIVMGNVHLIFVYFLCLEDYDRLEALDPIVVLDLLNGRASGVDREDIRARKARKEYRRFGNLLPFLR